jgi:putative restriction endonuclease
VQSTKGTLPEKRRPIPYSLLNWPDPVDQRASPTVHIPFSVSKDNDPRNGMALCRNHHWAMDKYLVAPIPAKPRPVWRVSNDLDRRIEGQTDLLSLDGTAVLQPRDPRYHPREDTLKWRMDHLRRTE